MLKTINLYQICDWVVIPATARYSCSLVDLLASDEAEDDTEVLLAQPPDFFVSHWSQGGRGGEVDFAKSVRPMLECSNVCRFTSWAYIAAA